MIPMISTFKTAGRALVVAAALGAGLVAAPAMAAPAFSFNFGINNGQPSFGFDVNSNRHGPHRLNVCLSDREVIRGLDRQGYDRIRITRSNQRTAGVSADYGWFRYVLNVNKCNGVVRVVDRDRIHRGNPWNHRGRGHDARYDGNAIGFSFAISN